jgi:CelD/BcsL family acetyltransferase involved in cellulose biosynthesis
MAAVGLPLADLAERTPVGADAPAARRDRVAFLDLAAAEALAHEWDGLATRSAEDNIFFAADFALPAIGALGHDVSVATLRNAEGRLIALAPVTRVRLGRVAPAMRIWSHNYGPLGVPLIERGGLDGAAETFVAGLAAGGMSLILPDIQIDGPVAVALTRAAAHAGRPVAVVEAHRRAGLIGRNRRGGDLRAELPTRRRKEFSRQMRRLAELGEVTIESATALDQVAPRFEEFMALETAGWKGKAGTALLSSPGKAAFARAAVRNRARVGGVRIDAMRVAGKPAAMVVSFLAGHTAFTWKIAHDEGLARFSPGAQLMLELPKSMFAGEGVARIDSCAAADHPMIDHLWKDRLAVGTLVIGPPGGGLLHRIGLAAFRAEIAARAIARRLRQRLRARHVSGSRET